MKKGHIVLSVFIPSLLMAAMLQSATLKLQNQGFTGCGNPGRGCGHHPFGCGTTKTLPGK